MEVDFGPGFDNESDEEEEEIVNPNDELFRYRNLTTDPSSTPPPPPAMAGIGPGPGLIAFQSIGRRKRLASGLHTLGSDYSGAEKHKK